MDQKADFLLQVLLDARELQAEAKDDIETFFRRMSDSRNYKDKVYQATAEISKVLTKWMDSELEFYGNVFEQFQLSPEDNPSRIDILVMHRNGFNACSLLKVENEPDLYCFIGSIRDPKEDQHRYNHLGIQAQNLGDFAAALAHFEEGFKIGNSSRNTKAEIKDRMATCCMNLGRYREAISLWEEALTSTHWDFGDRAAIQDDIRKAKSRI